MSYIQVLLLCILVANNFTVHMLEIKHIYHYLQGESLYFIVKVSISTVNLKNLWSKILFEYLLYNNRQF